MRIAIRDPPPATRNPVAAPPTMPIPTRRRPAILARDVCDLVTRKPLIATSTRTPATKLGQVPTRPNRPSRADSRLFVRRTLTQAEEKTPQVGVYALPGSGSHEFFATPQGRDPATGRILGQSCISRSQICVLNISFCRPFRADEGTRTLDLLHGKTRRRVCAADRSCLKSATEQGCLGSLVWVDLRPKVAFCASAVPSTYHGVVACLANRQHSFAPWCICVSALVGAGLEPAC